MSHQSEGSHHLDEKGRPPPPRRGKSVRREDDSDLWKQFRAGDDRAVQALVDFHSRIVTGVARSHMGRGVDYAAMYEVGQQALRTAIFEFNHDLRDFVPFAKTVVRNQIVDLIRDLSPLTRHERRQAAEFDLTASELSLELGRPATPDEVYSKLEWSRTKSSNHRRALQRRPGQSLDALAEKAGELPVDEDARDPAEAFQDSEDRARLAHELAAMDELHQQVIVKRYLQNQALSQKRTAKALGITEHRVKEVEKHALKKLGEAIDGLLGHRATE